MGQFKLKRINHQILEALKNNAWESQAVFNPGTWKENEHVHMLYRGVQGNNFSSIGYARLDATGKVILRGSSPLISPEWEMEKQGCEDPRIVYFEDRYLIFYTGFDGYDMKKGENARVLIAETYDFESVKKLAVIGPDRQDKDAMIFPEKIDGKVAFVHRIVPDIQVAYFDDIAHLIKPEADYWLNYMRTLDKHVIMCPECEWESAKIGAGPPPFRTEAGWLLIYHAVDKSLTYRAGAALLDFKNPQKVLARLPYPILEPERDYEKFGDVNMVVFPEGIVCFGDEIQVYYGAADKTIGLAVGSLSELLTELWRHVSR
jgi:predicted GH43/DUF377 family glycosyl hydrolase